MTFQGTIIKLSYLVGIVSISALLSIYVSLDAIASGNASVVAGLTWGGMLGGVVVALIFGFMRPENPATLMTIYAVLMGMFVGSISLMFELAFVLLFKQDLEPFSSQPACLVFIHRELLGYSDI